MTILLLFISNNFLTQSLKNENAISFNVVGLKYYGLLKQGNDSFKKVVLNIGVSYNGYIQILNAKDFEPHSEFITKGAFNLITE